jgi:hypothetical protein
MKRSGSSSDPRLEIPSDIRIVLWCDALGHFATDVRRRGPRSDVNRSDACRRRFARWRDYLPTSGEDSNVSTWTAISAAASHRRRKCFTLGFGRTGRQRRGRGFGLGCLESSQTGQRHLRAGWESGGRLGISSCPLAAY